jgi:branched-chain amino acid aminotransferase
MHQYFLHNGRLVPNTETRLVSPGQTGLLNGWGVFSTLRILDGVLFAYERHWERMRRDAARMRVPFPPDAEAFRTELGRLIQANGARNATLRVAVVRNRGGMFETPSEKPAFDVVAFTVDLRNWGESARLGVVANARYAACEFAGAKILSWSQNLTWYERAQERGYDEVVLLNELGLVSECTSANLFAIRGREIVTPPLGSGCLPGVTRAVLLEEIAYPGHEWVEADLSLQDLESADEVFMTSSTREVHPVTWIEGLNLRGASARTRRLGEIFHSYMEAYAGLRKGGLIPAN